MLICLFVPFFYLLFFSRTLVILKSKIQAHALHRSRCGIFQSGDRHRGGGLLHAHHSQASSKRSRRNVPSNNFFLKGREGEPGGRKEGRKEEKKGGRNEGRKEGRKEGRENRKEGRKE